MIRQQDDCLSNAGGRGGWDADAHDFAGSARRKFQRKGTISGMGLHVWQPGPSWEIPAMHKGNHAHFHTGPCSELSTFPQTSYPFSTGFSGDSPEKGPELEK